MTAVFSTVAACPASTAITGDPAVAALTREDKLFEAASEIKLFPYRKPCCTEALKTMDSAEMERQFLPLTRVVMDNTSEEQERMGQIRKPELPG